MHPIDAGLETELSKIYAGPTLDVPRRLRLQIERRNDEYERTARSDPLVGIAKTKCARRAPKDRKRVTDTMFQAQMRRPLPFALIEWRDLGIVGVKSRVGVIDCAVGVTRVDGVLLDTSTDRNVGVRP